MFIKHAECSSRASDDKDKENVTCYKAFGLSVKDCKMKSSQTLCPVLKIVYILLAVIVTVPESLDALTLHALDDQGDNLTMTFNPSNVTDLLYDKHTFVSMTYNYSGSYEIALKLVSHNKEVAQTDDEVYMIRPKSELQSVTLRRTTQDFLNQTIRINGIFLGRTYLEFFTNVSLLNTTSEAPSSKQRHPSQTSDAPSSEQRHPGQTAWYSVPGARYPVTVIRKDGPLNTTFTVVIIILVVLANVAMGCKVDLNVVAKTMKKPIAPCIGLFSQFIIMPMLGFAISQMFDFEPILALAILATGCAPGGGASNTYTYLAGGNVSLSVSMTLISTLASLAMVPLWLFTLGSLYVYKDGDFNIPYQNIILSLLGLIIPVIIGLVIQRRRPGWVPRILRGIVPLMVVLIIVILSVGIYANLYIFRIFRPNVIIAGALLPNAGFLLGGLLSLAFLQTWKDIKTIAIETGLQNTGVPIVLLLSLPKPEGDIAIVAPIASALFTPIILWIFIIIRLVYKTCCKKDNAEKCDTAKKCLHTDINEPRFLKNIPCRRTSKTPPECPGHASDSSDDRLLAANIVRSSGDFDRFPNDKKSEKTLHGHTENGSVYPGDIPAATIV